MGALLMCIVIGSVPISAERIVCEKEMEITGLPPGSTGFFANAETKVTTVDGVIYCAYLDAERNVRVRKKGTDGAESDAYVHGPVANDPYHMAPVVGVDGAGYIHVSGGMHDSQEWQYFLSNDPGEIDSFERQEPGSDRCPPGEFITYPEFTTDRNGYLYVSSRQGTKNPSFLGGSIARYDHETGTCTPLGVRRGRWHFVIDHEEPRHYQRWFMRICFDSENTLHLAWKVNALGPMPNFGDGSHVMYAALRDGETTWHKADGTPIADLPLTIENASVVAEDLQDPELAVYGIGVTPEGQPVINFRYTRGHTPEGKDKGWVVKWTGEDWGRVALPRAVVIPTLLMSDRESALFTHGPGGNTVYLSEDGGESWRTLTIPYERGYANYHSFDYRCFAETGEARLAAFFADKGAIEVWTVRRATE